MVQRHTAIALNISPIWRTICLWICLGVICKINVAAFNVFALLCIWNCLKACILSPCFVSEKHSSFCQEDRFWGTSTWTLMYDFGYFNHMGFFSPSLILILFDYQCFIVYLLWTARSNYFVQRLSYLYSTLILETAHIETGVGSNGSFLSRCPGLRLVMQNQNLSGE